MAKKTSKPKRGKKPEKQEPQDFNQRAIMFLNVLLRMVQEQRARSSGAIKFGRDGMHVLLSEAADTAMKAGPNGYLAAATYALVAAMMSAGQWDDPKPGDKKPSAGEKPAKEEKPTDE